MMKYLKETHMLDYFHPTIQKLIHDKQWKGMNEFNRIQSIYNYVRDEIFHVEYMALLLIRNYKEEL